MSFARHSMPAETDDDAARVAAARSEAIKLMLAALARVSLPIAERTFVVTMQRRAGLAALPLTERQEQYALRLAWRFRRQMPPHLPPRTNPDDPLSPDRVAPLPLNRPTMKELLDG